LDGAGNHGSDQLVPPANIILHPLPALYIQRNPKIVKSITSSPYIVK
jgi:hypothetical protein